MLIIARDTTHAGALLQLIQSDQFFEGRYKDKVIQVDSSQTGAQEDEMVQRLLAVESPEEPTEIVIHVNMLKEGWDVTNLYTIVPLRAANARILIEQSIGRGLRLPYGKRTGVSAVDRLSIVAHDRFQEIIDEANRPDSAIRLTQVILDPATDLQKSQTVVAAPNLAAQIGAASAPVLPAGAPPAPAPVFKTEAEQKIAQATVEVIQRHFEGLPSSSQLRKPEVQQEIAKKVAAAMTPLQPVLPVGEEGPDIGAIVAKASELYEEQTIDIPRVLVIPKGLVTTGFHPFKVDCSNVHYQPVERDLLIQALRTREQETLSFGGSVVQEKRLEDYLVRAIIDYDDIAYDEQADLLYDLAGQVVTHLRSYLSEEDTKNVLLYHQKQLAALVHAQMQEHQWESATEYEVQVSKGFTQLKSSAYTVKEGEPVYDFRETVQDKSRIAQMLFDGFKRCLYPFQKFQSDPERKLALILDRESKKWFRPAKGQFQIWYKDGIDFAEYVPDFVAEDDQVIYLLEPKASNEMATAEVLAKRDAAALWCARASQHALNHGGKPWKYLLIPHDAIAANMTLAGLASQFSVTQ
jgi:type III restriction enzyme